MVECDRSVQWGAAASGRTLAIARVERARDGDFLQAAGTAQFRLSDATQPGLRVMAQRIHEFLHPQPCSKVAFCRTETGYGDEGLAHELRVETLLQFLPGVNVVVQDGDRVREWALITRPALPVNCRHWPDTLAQVRAIEVAQFSLENGMGTPLERRKPEREPA